MHRQAASLLLAIYMIECDRQRGKTTQGVVRAKLWYIYRYMDVGEGGGEWSRTRPGFPCELGRHRCRSGCHSRSRVCALVDG